MRALDTFLVFVQPGDAVDAVLLTVLLLMGSLGVAVLRVSVKGENFQALLI